MAIVQLWPGPRGHPHRKGPCNQRWNQTKGWVKGPGRAADGRGRQRAGPGRWHGCRTGITHWALFLACVGAQLGPGASGPGTPTAGGWGRVGDGPERVVPPLQGGDSRVHELHLRQDVSLTWTCSTPRSLRTQPLRPGEWASEANTFPRHSKRPKTILPTLHLTCVLLTCTEGRAVVNVGGLPKGAVGATYVMVVSAQDHRRLRCGRA